MNPPSDSERSRPGAGRLRLPGGYYWRHLLEEGLGEGAVAWTAAPVAGWGTLFVAATRHGLCRIHLGEPPDVEAELARALGRDAPGTTVLRDDALLRPVVRRIGEFLERPGEVELDLPVDAAGTPFRRSVWESLAAIPAGEVRTYGAIAAALGRPGGSRAVGGACGANPVPLVVPCHRVVGAGGRLTGFGLGVAVKERLLAAESGERRLPL